MERKLLSQPQMIISIFSQILFLYYHQSSFSCIFDVIDICHFLFSIISINKSVSIIKMRIIGKKGTLAVSKSIYYYIHIILF